MGMFVGASELVAVGQVSGTPSGRMSTAGDKKKVQKELTNHTAALNTCWNSNPISAHEERLRSSLSQYRP